MISWLHGRCDKLDFTTFQDEGVHPSSEDDLRCGGSVPGQEARAGHAHHENLAGQAAEAQIPKVSSAFVTLIDSHVSRFC